jgi:hypothetical protein
MLRFDQKVKTGGISDPLSSANVYPSAAARILVGLGCGSLRQTFASIGRPVNSNSRK